MKKYIISTILLFFASLTTNAQIRVSYAIGYASYRMDEMKDVAAILLDGKNAFKYMDGKLKQIDNYPSSITHTGEITYQRKNEEMGFRVNFMTTGAKYALSDYSGKYSMKTVLDAYKISFVYRNHFYNKKIDKNSLSLFCEFSPGVVLSSLEAKEEFQLYESDIYHKTTDNIVSNNVGYAIQSMLGSRFSFQEHYFASLSAGYDFSFYSSVGADRINWSGIRINAAIGYKF